MKALIFDCPFGIAGDMVVGSLLDAGAPFGLLRQELKKLDLKGYRLSVRHVRCGAFRARKFSVHVSKQKRQAVGFEAIRRLIEKSSLDQPVKRRAIRTFRLLGCAEAKVHGVPLSRIHFHEVGAVDSILDIVGAAVAMHSLGIDRVYVRRLAVGYGTVQGSHGIMPVPVPGTLALLKGFRVSQSNYPLELVTPTGAAILAASCRPQDKIPSLRILSTGYGAGDRRVGAHRGFLRVSVAENQPALNV